MITILYTIFTLFFVRGLFTLFEGGIWTLSFGSMIFSILGLFFLHNKYENKFIPHSSLRPIDSSFGHCAANPGNDKNFEKKLDKNIKELLN